MDTKSSTKGGAVNGASSTAVEGAPPAPGGVPFKLKKHKPLEHVWHGPGLSTGKDHTKVQPRAKRPAKKGGLSRAMLSLALRRWQLLKGAVRGIGRAKALVKSDEADYIAKSQQALEEAKASNVCLEVAHVGELKSINYVTQGDASTYTDQGLTERYKLRRSPVIKAAVKAWWNWMPRQLDKEDDGTWSAEELLEEDDYRVRGVLKETYCAMVVIIQMMLMPRFKLVPDKDYDPNEDWEADCEGGGVMHFPEFFNALFELADMWCTDVNEEAYADLLQGLLTDAQAADTSGGMMNRLLAKFRFGPNVHEAAVKAKRLREQAKQEHLRRQAQRRKAAALKAIIDDVDAQQHPQLEPPPEAAAAPPTDSGEQEAVAESDDESVGDEQVASDAAAGAPAVDDEVVQEIKAQARAFHKLFVTTITARESSSDYSFLDNLEIGGGGGGGTPTSATVAAIEPIEEGSGEGDQGLTDEASVAGQKRRQALLDKGHPSAHIEFGEPWHQTDEAAAGAAAAPPAAAAAAAAAPLSGSSSPRGAPALGAAPTKAAFAMPKYEAFHASRERQPLYANTGERRHPAPQSRRAPPPKYVGPNTAPSSAPITSDQIRDHSLALDGSIVYNGTGVRHVDHHGAAAAPPQEEPASVHQQALQQIHQQLQQQQQYRLDPLGAWGANGKNGGGGLPVPRLGGGLPRMIQFGGPTVPPGTSRDAAAALQGPEAHHVDFGAAYRHNAHLPFLQGKIGGGGGAAAHQSGHKPRTRSSPTPVVASNIPEVFGGNGGGGGGGGGGGRQSPSAMAVMRNMTYSLQDTGPYGSGGPSAGVAAGGGGKPKAQQPHVVMSLLQNGSGGVQQAAAYCGPLVMVGPSRGSSTISSTSSSNHNISPNRAGPGTLGHDAAAAASGGEVRGGVGGRVVTPSQFGFAISGGIGRSGSPGGHTGASDASYSLSPSRMRSEPLTSSASGAAAGAAGRRSSHDGAAATEGEVQSPRRQQQQPHTGLPHVAQGGGGTPAAVASPGGTPAAAAAAPASVPAKVMTLQLSLGGGLQHQSPTHNTTASRGFNNSFPVVGSGGGGGGVGGGPLGGNAPRRSTHGPSTQQQLFGGAISLHTLSKNSVHGGAGPQRGSGSELGGGGGPGGGGGEALPHLQLLSVAQRHKIR